MGKGRGCVPSKPNKKPSSSASSLQVPDSRKAQIIAKDEDDEDGDRAHNPPSISSASSTKPPASTHSEDARGSAPGPALASGSSSSSSNLKIYIM